MLGTFFIDLPLSAIFNLIYRYICISKKLQNTHHLHINNRKFLPPILCVIQNHNTKSWFLSKQQTTWLPQTTMSTCTNILSLEKTTWLPQTTMSTCTNILSLENQTHQSQFHETCLNRKSCATSNWMQISKNLCQHNYNCLIRS